MVVKLRGFEVKSPYLLVTVIYKIQIFIKMGFKELEFHVS